MNALAHFAACILRPSLLILLLSQSVPFDDRVALTPQRDNREAEINFRNLPACVANMACRNTYGQYSVNTSPLACILLGCLTD